MWRSRGAVNDAQVEADVIGGAIRLKIDIPGDFGADNFEEFLKNYKSYKAYLTKKRRDSVPSTSYSMSSDSAKSSSNGFRN
jgi:hypothetical protein